MLRADITSDLDGHGAPPTFHLFADLLQQSNHLAASIELVFLPGMCFGDMGNWWNDALRTTPHEGIDVKYYSCGAHPVPLPFMAKIPAVCPGEVVAVSSDFLGQTIWVRKEGEKVWYVAYAHCRPTVGIRRQTVLHTGDTVGFMADPQPLLKVPAHFHCSIFTTEANPACFSWKTIHQHASFVDPAGYL